MIDVAILEEAGLTPDQILRVVKAEQRRELETQAAVREKERQRGRERREKEKLQQIQQARPENPAASKESTASKDACTLSSFFLPLVATSSEIQKEELSVAGRRASDWPPNYRELFWQKYPNKVGRPKALAKLDRVRQRGIPWAEIWGGLERYVVKNDDRAWCNPETWINQERWTDQPAKPNATADPPKTPLQIMTEAEIERRKKLNGKEKHDVRAPADGSGAEGADPFSDDVFP